MTEPTTQQSDDWRSFVDAHFPYTQAVMARYEQALNTAIRAELTRSHQSCEGLKITLISDLNTQKCILRLESSVPTTLAHLGKMNGIFPANLFVGAPTFRGRSAPGKQEYSSPYLCDIIKGVNSWLAEEYKIDSKPVTAFDLDRGAREAKGR